MLAPVFLLLICFFPKCGNDSTRNCRKKPSPFSNRTVIGDGVLRPKTASCSKTVGRQFTAHYDSRCCRLCTLYHNINSRLMVQAPMQKTLYTTTIMYICNDFINTGNALGPVAWPRHTAVASLVRA